MESELKVQMLRLQLTVIVAHLKDNQKVWFTDRKLMGHVRDAEQLLERTEK